MSVHATLDPANRVQLPAEWLEALGLRGIVLLDKTSDGILIRPCALANWNDVFTGKLAMRQVTPANEECQVTKDDLLF